MVEVEESWFWRARQYGKGPHYDPDIVVTVESNTILALLFFISKSSGLVSTLCSPEAISYRLSLRQTDSAQAWSFATVVERIS